MNEDMEFSICMAYQFRKQCFYSFLKILNMLFFFDYGLHYLNVLFLHFDCVMISMIAFVVFSLFFGL